MYSLIFDEGEIWIAILLLFPIFITLIVVGFIVPLGAVITYLIYHFRLHYKFTWGKDSSDGNMQQ